MAEREAFIDNYSLLEYEHYGFLWELWVRSG